MLITPMGRAGEAAQAGTPEDGQAQPSTETVPGNPFLTAAMRDHPEGQERSRLPAEPWQGLAGMPSSCRRSSGRARTPPRL